MKILFIGDVVGKGGREAVRRLVPDLRREFNAQLVIVNGENSAAGSGISASCARELLEAADVITLGDHAWDQKGFDAEIAQFKNVIRPANYAAGQPGRGFGVFSNPAGGEVAVIALQGKVFMRDCAYCPFETADRILKTLPPTVKSVLVDFHAEATSEKLAMQHYLDGRVTAVVGTHTHVQTADARVSASGTAMLSDTGMVGAEMSILGRAIPDVLKKFTGGMPVRLPVVETGIIRLDAAVISYDAVTGKASAIETFSRTTEV
ncbi:MAG: YmdB family metallophosphoesterase [Victivallaceae bacterium]|nr:YmdB family metallophosphoesterase [Victivallaceae bacterium]